MSQCMIWSVAENDPLIRSSFAKEAEGEILAVHMLLAQALVSFG